MQIRTIYFSSILKQRFPQISNQLEAILTTHDIAFGYLENTKDIWARDYMPIITQRDNVVKYIYDPDYLKSKQWHALKTNLNQVRIENKGIEVDTELRLVLDGGNFLKYNNKALMSDKIYQENFSLSKQDINEKIKIYFDVEELIVIPKQPYEMTGHIDGMMRWIDERTILVNDFSISSRAYVKKLYKAIAGAQLNTVQMSYSKGFYTKTRNWGAYINYLMIGRLLIVPLHDISEDEKVLKFLSDVFRDYKVIGLSLNDIISEGGALNCISCEY